MASGKRTSRRAFVEEKLCVACGCCVKVCPKAAVSVYNGIKAVVDMEKCIGCGKCVRECPASVIEIREVGNEKEMVASVYKGQYASAL